MFKKLIYFLNVLLAVVGVLFFYYVFFWTPDVKKARNLIRSTSSYYPPISTNLAYSKNYWESPNSKKPRSICFVFEYSQKDLIALQNYNFHHNDRKNWYKESPIPVNEGCNKFRSNLKPTDLALFKKNYEYFQRLQGVTIFINKHNRLVLFELYLFD